MHKVPLFFWFDIFLEARAEILEKICWFFGRFEETKRTFWNQLTFSSKFQNVTHTKRKYLILGCAVQGSKQATAYFYLHFFFGKCSTWVYMVIWPTTSRNYPFWLPVNCPCRHCNSVAWLDQVRLLWPSLCVWPNDGNIIIWHQSVTLFVWQWSARQVSLICLVVISWLPM